MRVFCCHASEGWHLVENIDKTVDVKSMEKTDRVFARLVSRRLSAEEIQQVAGGKVTCKGTNNPTADVKCTG
jgi:hypothetical protein